MNIKAVLFDMDGLMVDTESLATEAFIHSAKKQGYDMTKEDLDKYGLKVKSMGRSFEEDKEFFEAAATVAYKISKLF